MFWERLAFTESPLGAWQCLDVVHLAHHLLARRVPEGSSQKDGATEQLSKQRGIMTPAQGGTRAGPLL